MYKAEIPIITVICTRLEPIFVPTAIPDVSIPFRMFMLEMMCVPISGRDVPIERIVNPMNVPESPYSFESVLQECINSSALRTRMIIAMIVYRKSSSMICFGYVNYIYFVIFLFSMIEIDGSWGEAGGQIMRTALALSVLTGKSFKINNIRKGRKVSGLKNQHLFCIKALQQLCEAEVIGDEVCSLEVEFKPGKIKNRKIDVDIKTAGSITLLLQSLLLPCMFSGKKIQINIKGGTDVRWSPQFDYFSEVILPQFRRYADIECKLMKRGYYPKGGGEVGIKINGRKLEELKPLDLVEQGKLIMIRGVSHSHIDLEKAMVSERQARSAEVLLQKFGVPVNVRAEYCNSLSIGSGISLFAFFSKDEDIDKIDPIILGADVLGEKGKKAEIVGKECVEKLIKEMESVVDEHLCDNLIPLLGLVKGSLRTSNVSDHTLTNIYVTGKFLDVKFDVDGNCVNVK